MVKPFRLKGILKARASNCLYIFIYVFLILSSTFLVSFESILYCLDDKSETWGKIASALNWHSAALA